MRKITTVIVLASLGVAMMGGPALAAPGGVPGPPSDTPAPPADPGRPPEPGSGTPGTPVEVSIEDDTVEEGMMSMVLVTLSAASANDTTVDWTTSDDTAVAGEDYTGGSDTLTIPAGETSGTIDIDTTDDAADEPDETFTVTLSNPSPNATIVNGTATVTITENDEPEANCVDDGFEPENDAQEGAILHDSTTTGVWSTVCPEDVDWWKTTVNPDEAVFITIEPNSTLGESHLDDTVLVVEFLEDGAEEPTALPDCENVGLDDSGCFNAEDPLNDGSIDGWHIEYFNDSDAGGTLFFSIALPSTDPADGYDYVLFPVNREPLSE